MYSANMHAYRYPGLQSSLQCFLNSCDATLQDLNSAYRTETLDAATSNNSLVGWLVSNHSWEKNNRVANRVDSLRQEAARINSMLANTGLLRRGDIAPLNTFFSGEGIRRAEAAEHSFLADYFTNSWFSSLGSTNTMAQISQTLSTVQALKHQAVQLNYSLGSQPYAREPRPYYQRPWAPNDCRPGYT